MFCFLSAAASRDLIKFHRLQVSSPMEVEVITDPSQSHASLDIAADSMGLGWTVKASVEPMTFGRTLLLGMDERAARQGFHWSTSKAKQATLRVPEPLQEVSATGGAQVLVDVVTNALLADTKSNLTVLQFLTNNENRSTFFMSSSGANITVKDGNAGKAFVTVGAGCTVKLGCLVQEGSVEAEQGGKLFINADEESLNLNADDESAVTITAAVNESENEEVDFEKSLSAALEESPVIP